MENEEYNCLREIREAKKLSRFEASALIERVSGTDCSPQKIQRLEAKSEEDIHPKEIMLISESYSCPKLKYYYCSNVCPLGVTMPQVMADYDLPKAVLNLMLALDAVRDQQKRLVEISSDGRIDQIEIKDFRKIQRELQKLSDMYQTILLRVEEQEEQEKK